EFNTRFGDPETHVVLQLLEKDLAQVTADVMVYKDLQLEWKDGACVGVVVAYNGYQETYHKEVLLLEKEAENDAFVVQAETKRTEADLVTNGGLVLLVGATGKTLDQAAVKAYDHLTIYDETDDFYYRTNIAK